MIRKNDEILSENRGIMYEGAGEVQMKKLLRGEEELCDKGRLFAKLTLPVGGEVGRHVHKGEFEIFYVVSGTGIFYDNGTECACAAGDVLYTQDGEEHGLRNTGEEPLEFLALILYV